jgi:peptidoglycan/xylan/chitin deacetylase (PgdA/CDA1 family)
VSDAHPVMDVPRRMRAAAQRLRLRVSDAPRGLVLVYHAVAERTGDRATEIVPPHAADLLAEHVRHLERHFRIVATSEILEAASARGRGDRPPVAITFDDDLPSHVRLAAPLLERHGVRATFFLTGAGLDGPVTFWWERLQRAFDNGVSDDDRRRLAEVAGMDPRELEGPGAIRRVSRAVQALPDGEEAKELISRLAGPDPEDSGLSEADIRRLIDGGHTIGFHTLRHDRLTILGDDVLERAFTDGRARLEAIAGPLDEIAYPHGRANARVAAAAKRAGFRIAFTTEWRPVRRDDDPHLVGRLEPPFEAMPHFESIVAATVGERP